MSHRDEIIALRDSALRLMREDKGVDGMVCAMRADFLEQKDRAIAAEAQIAALTQRVASLEAMVRVAHAVASGGAVLTEDVLDGYNVLFGGTSALDAALAQARAEGRAEGEADAMLERQHGLLAAVMACVDEWEFHYAAAKRQLIAECLIDADRAVARMRSVESVADTIAALARGES